MSIQNRIKKLENIAESVKNQQTPLFFDSHDEYMAALQRNEVKEHHICLINDVPEHEDDELIEKGYVTIHQG